MLKKRETIKRAFHIDKDIINKLDEEADRIGVRPAIIIEHSLELFFKKHKV